MRHYLSMYDMTADELRDTLALSAVLKAERGREKEKPLQGEVWGLIFSKASTRTRVSFEVGLRELGADVIFLTGDAIQLNRGEPMKDTARVMGRMLHGAVIRTFAQQDVVDFAHYGKITTVNALTDDEHPCQVVTDLFTIQELRGSVENKKVVFVGDGACNMGVSWIRAAHLLKFELVIASPKGYQPAPEIVAEGSTVRVVESAAEAAKDADVLYTDVWVSMGKESEKQERIATFGSYQINQELLSLAKPGALVMHCLPAYRGLEITEEVLEAHADTIFQQAENRLHAQKAIVSMLRKLS